MSVRCAYPTEVIRHLVQNSGRNQETIRYALKQFDQTNPTGVSLLDDHASVPNEADRQIHQYSLYGESVNALAKRHYRSRANIRRELSEMCAQRIVDLPLDYIPNDHFAAILGSQELEKLTLGTMPLRKESSMKARAPRGLPPYLTGLYDVPLLTRTQESHLFRKMNYLKYKAVNLRNVLDANHPNSRLMDLIEKCHDEAVVTKNQILCANLRLVVAIAKRYVRPSESFFDLISDGNMSLIRAVEKFDFSRGFKFSTYASWAIMKNFGRTIPEEHRHREHFRTSRDEMFLLTEDVRSDQLECECLHVQRKSMVKIILRQLDDREQQIIIRRFGLQQWREPLTLKQVGAELGVSKERVRQIEARALQKLHKAVKEMKGEFSG